MLLERGWHLAVCVTDLPLQTARRPVIAHVSATHGVAVLSMPALGPVSVRKRTAETIVRLVGHILGDLAQAEGAAGRLPLAAGRDPSHGRTGRPHGARRARRGFRRAGHHRQHLVAAGHAARQPPVAASAAAHAHAGGGLRGGGVRAGVQRHLAARPLSRAAAPGRHRSWLGGGHHRDDHGQHRAVGAQPAPGRARAGGLVQHRHRGHRRPRRGRAVPGPVRDHARRGAAARAGQPARPGPRALGRRGRPGEPGLAGHFDRDAGRRTRRGPGERRDRARGSVHLSAGYADRRRRWSAVTSRGVLRAQPSAGSHGGCQRG